MHVNTVVCISFEFWISERFTRKLTCQRRKLRPFSNEFNVLYSKENNPWLEEYSDSQAMEHSPREFEQEWVLCSIRSGKAIRAGLAGVVNMTLFRKIKEQGNKYRAQKYGVWGLADWMYCVSGQAEPLQEHEVSVCWCDTPSRSDSILGLEIYFDIPLESEPFAFFVGMPFCTVWVICHMHILL